MEKYTPRPGDIGLSASTGYIGKFIRLAQAAIGDWAVYTHAYIVLHDGYIVEAMPKGAQIDRLDKYDDRNTTFSQFDLTDEQRDRIVCEALKLVGTPYSFLDYLALGATHYNIRPAGIRKRVEDSGHMICSQLCTETYYRAGLQLFPDKRLSQDVTPGDLARLFLEYPNGKFLEKES